MTAATRPRVAVLGLGTLGAPMARHLAGVADVRTWNRSARDLPALAEAGVEHAASAVDAVTDADVVLTVLSDDRALTAVLDDAGVLAALKPGTVWIQSSTIGVDHTARWAERAAQAGVVLVDAPVLGTRGPAERGELTILASGPEDVRERVAPLFDAIGKATVWVGEAGAGTRLKLVVNAWLLSLVQVLAEALAFCKANGFDAETMFSTLELGGVSLPYVRLKGGAMDAESFPSDFTLELARKDLQLVLDAAAPLGLTPTAAATAMAGFDRAIEQGHGQEDYAVTYMAARYPK